MPLEVQNRSRFRKCEIDMPRVLIVYGTTEGQTAKICHVLGSMLRAWGMEADVIEAGRARDRGPEDYDGVVVAASVHGGRYQRAVRRWVQAHVGALARTPTAFVSVSLGVLQTDSEVQKSVLAIEQRFLTETGWHPSITKRVAGALVYTRYNWLKRWVMKQIAAKAGDDTDTRRDYEYTDWTGVRVLAQTFAELVRKRPSPSSRSTTVDSAQELLSTW
jgi:menaquinone-dependent protoporphyrinogen oxidase